MSTDHIYLPYLDWISNHAEEYLRLLHAWTLIDSRTYNLTGMEEMCRHLAERFSKIPAETREIPLEDRSVQGPDGSRMERSFGKALAFEKHREAAHRVFLCGHMDTVLNPVLRPENAARPGDGRMYGTGAADAKGGLVVMLAALECFERSPFAGKLAWEALIVPDEEVGSLGSRPLFEKAAGKYDLGLLFEPAQPDGALVGARMGSGNFSAIIHGRAAHAGRHIEAGRNAIEALADFIVALRKLRKAGDHIRINVGAVKGGGPVNVVPDLASCRFNIRVRDREVMSPLRQSIDQIASRISVEREVSIEVTGGFGRPPKPLNPEIIYLLEQLVSCGRALNLAVRWRSSGGVCDGNTLLAAGLPNVDSLGPVGDGLHTGEEYVVKSSVAERARLTALFLMKLAAGDIVWPPKMG